MTFKVGDKVRLDGRGWEKTKHYQTEVTVTRILEGDPPAARADVWTVHDDPDSEWYAKVVSTTPPNPYIQGKDLTLEVGGTVLTAEGKEFLNEKGGVWKMRDRISNTQLHGHNHYTAGMPEGVQVIDVIRAQDADFEEGNLIKYVLRWKYKNGLDDLKKARDYLDWIIEREENNLEG